MKKLLAIGEALVDIFNEEIKVGGAPLNVCGAYSKLGGKAYFIGKLSNDEYGVLIKNKMQEFNINNDYVSYTDAPTGKAYITTLDNGDRSFRFERNNCADQLLDEKEIKEEWFKDAFVLHFCSVSLDDYPSKLAHYKAIEYAKKNNCLVSFDINLRLSLFKDYNKLKKIVFEFMGYADVIKLSYEELVWLGKESKVEELFVNDVKLILLTLGEDGVICYLKNKEEIKVSGYKVDAIDTTGAGDAFIGAFLYCLSNYKSKDNLGDILNFANKYSALSVTKKGALDSYLSINEMKRII